MSGLIVFDLDGTLALIEHRQHLVKKPNRRWDQFFAACVDDLPNEPVITIFKALQAQGFRVEVWSGRSDAVRAETENWLAQYGVYPERLLMRTHGNHTPDDVLKEGWLLENGERPLVIFDDRDKVVTMWRRHGVTCCQVAPGDF